MTCSRRKIVGLLAALGAVTLLPRQSIGARPANEIVVGIPNNVYANLRDGHPSGVVVQAIDAILIGMGKQPLYVAVPASELNKAVDQGVVGISAVAVQTGKSPKFLMFSDPVVTEYNIVSVLRGKAFTIAGLADLHGKTLGGRTGYAYPLIENDPQIALQRFANDGELMRNLIFGRIDAAIISAVSDIYKFRAEGIMSRIDLLGQAVGSVPLRVALSAKLFTPEDLLQFNKNLAALQKSPQWDAILETNGMADLVRDWPVIGS